MLPSKSVKTNMIYLCALIPIPEVMYSGSISQSKTLAKRKSDLISLTLKNINPSIVEI